MRFTLPSHLQPNKEIDAPKISDDASEEPREKFVLPKHLVGTVYVPTRTKSRGRTPRVSLEGKEGSRVDARDYRGNGHWQADIEMGKGKAIGFIYVIRNLDAGKYYIGKKFYKSEGKLTKGQQTNWPWYISSCKALADDAKKQEKNGFDFIFIEEYVSRGALSWAETWSLVHSKVPENYHIFYNTLINKVSWKVKEGITEKHKDRLQRALAGEDMSELSKENDND